MFSTHHDVLVQRLRDGDSEEIGAEKLRALIKILPESEEVSQTYREREKEREKERERERERERFEDVWFSVLQKCLADSQREIGIDISFSFCLFSTFKKIKKRRLFFSFLFSSSK